MRRDLWVAPGLSVRLERVRMVIGSEGGEVRRWEGGREEKGWMMGACLFRRRERLDNRQVREEREWEYFWVLTSAALAMTGGRFEGDDEVIPDRDRRNIKLRAAADGGRRAPDRDETVAMRGKFGSAMAPSSFKMMGAKNERFIFQPQEMHAW